MRNIFKSTCTLEDSWENLSDEKLNAYEKNIKQSTWLIVLIWTSTIVMMLWSGTMDTIIAILFCGTAGASIILALAMHQRQLKRINKIRIDRKQD